MNDILMAKRSVLSYLAAGCRGDLQSVVSCDLRERLLRWMDEGGIALYFLHEVERHGHLPLLTGEWLLALRTRQELNRNRAALMFEEFRVAIEALNQSDITYAVVKGFSLAPDFCPSGELRHQTDVDLLISPKNISRATDALVACGYRVSSIEYDGDVRLVKPRSDYVAEKDENLYGLRAEAAIELHPRMCQPRIRAPFDLPDQWEPGVRHVQFRGLRFPVLSNADAFSLHALHAFQHLTWGWLRLGWMYELAHFLRSHQECDDVWRQATSWINSDARCRDAVGLILLQVSKFFEVTLPAQLQTELVDPLPELLLRWNSTYGLKLLLSDAEWRSTYFHLIERHFFHSAGEYRRFRGSLWVRRWRLLTHSGAEFIAKGVLRQLKLGLLWGAWQWGGRSRES